MLAHNCGCTYRLSFFFMIHIQLMVSSILIFLLQSLYHEEVRKHYQQKHLGSIEWSNNIISLGSCIIIKAIVKRVTMHDLIILGYCSCDQEHIIFSTVASLMCVIRMFMIAHSCSFTCTENSSFHFFHPWTSSFSEGTYRHIPQCSVAPPVTTLCSHVHLCHHWLQLLWLR